MQAIKSSLSPPLSTSLGVCSSLTSALVVQISYFGDCFSGHNCFKFLFIFKPFLVQIFNQILNEIELHLVDVLNYTFIHTLYYITCLVIPLRSIAYIFTHVGFHWFKSKT